MVKPAIPNIRQWFQKWGVEQDGPQGMQGISVSIFQKGFTPKGLWGLDNSFIYKMGALKKIVNY